MSVGVRATTTIDVCRKLAARAMDQLSQSTALEFLGLLLADREAGRERPLAEYLAQFPGREEVIAEAFAAARRSAEIGTAAADEQQVGPFRLLRELGRGGQGAVWLARDERLERLVAIKLVPRSPLFGEISQQFQREARAASRLEHPGICAVYDIGADDRVAWIAMRYVEGETLAQRTARGERDTASALGVLEQTARALHVAHAAGVVHRDIKPSNVMVTPRGEPVILDFGIARDTENGAPLTLTGDALGTPAYMAPEELRGEKRASDPRGDVWSLGVTAYETLTGARPFDAPTREGLIRAILSDDPADVRSLAPGLPRDLSVVLATALAKEIDRRYQTALDLAEDLRRVREGEPIRARPASPWQRFDSWRRRNPALAWSLTALFVVLATGLGVSLKLLERSNAALESRERLLGDVTQLSDQTAARELLERERQLWPANESIAAAMSDWLASARLILARRDGHAAARVQIAQRTDLDPDPAKNATARAWLIEQLDELLGSLETLAVTSAKVESRLAFAQSVRRRSIDEHRAEWDRATAEIASDPRYGGLRLAPQLGLVPLGRDPHSGLQEFAHIASGEIPQRDPATGELAMTEASGIVLVLFPAGSIDIGCEKPSDARPLGSPNADANAARWDGPVRRAQLDPFFLSKFEMTQGQWLRHTGANPSVYQAPSRLVSATSPLLHPVEHVTWYEAREVLRQLELQLPTEARWEVGARGGTHTPWFTGEDVASLKGFANIADKYAREHDGGDNWHYDLTFEDGFVGHAPIGSFRANAYGMLDALGNIEEWCLDTWEDLAAVEPRAGDGLLVGQESACVLRGGSFSDNPLDARCGYRVGNPGNLAAPNWGVRPARDVER